MKRHLPNTLTLLNLLSGCIGIYFVFHGELVYAAYAIWLAAVFDFLDGFTARLLGVASSIGKELDSLADLVTFGVLPAFLMMALITDPVPEILRFVPLVIALFAALRLAKFNVDESQSSSFLGIPTPAVAFFVSGLPFWQTTNSELFSLSVVITTSLILSALMVLPIRMIALKFNNYAVRDNWQKYGLVATGLLLLVIMGAKSFPITISLYLLLSLLFGRKEAIN